MISLPTEEGYAIAGSVPANPWTAFTLDVERSRISGLPPILNSMSDCSSNPPLRSSCRRRRFVFSNTKICLLPTVTVFSTEGSVGLLYTPFKNLYNLAQKPEAARPKLPAITFIRGRKGGPLTTGQEIKRRTGEMTSHLQGPS